MKHLILLLSFVFIQQICSAQSACRKIDSLQRVLIILKSDSTKTKTVDTYNAFAAAFAEANSKHTAAIYAQKALQLAEKVNYQKGIADALIYIALFDTQNIKGLENTIDNYQKALNIYKVIDDKKRIIEILEIIGTFYFKSENIANPTETYKKAINSFQEAINIREAVSTNAILKGNKVKLAEDYEIIGELYTNLRDDEKALAALGKAQELRAEIGDDKLYNTHLLAKYQRIKELEEKVKNAQPINLVIGFSIVIFILGFLLLINVLRKNEAYKVLKENNIVITPKKFISRVN